MLNLTCQNTSSANIRSLACTRLKNSASASTVLAIRETVQPFSSNSVTNSLESSGVMNRSIGPSVKPARCAFAVVFDGFARGMLLQFVETLDMDFIILRQQFTRKFFTIVRYSRSIQDVVLAHSPILQVGNFIVSAIITRDRFSAPA